ncbi:MAG: GNAT family N-acetyltransferase [Planctomycetales bacterium]|nr:GNAT family N-acetyltransferase [Planctomycetales bacterium]
MTSYHRHRLNELSTDDLHRWVQLQEETPELDSPFFRPEFARAVDAVRNDVEVVVVKQQGEPVAFFPFQRDRLGTGRPVGGPLSGCQGVIARRTTMFDPLALLDACGTTAWKFDHLVTHQTPLAPYHSHFEAAPYIDLSQGFAAYRAARRKAGSQRISKILSRARKVEREHGHLELVPHANDVEVLNTLVRWKRQQYRRTGLTDVFNYPWTLALLEHLLTHPAADLEPMLTLLCAGDAPVAISYGLRSRGVLYGWFTAFDRAYARYGPGMMMAVLMAQAVVPLGVRRIDLGKGDDEFKLRLMSDSFTLASGTLTAPSLTNSIRAGVRQSINWARTTPLAAPVEIPLRMTQRLRDWLVLQ